VTSRDELTRAATRSTIARSRASSRAAIARSKQAATPRWTRRRGTLGVFAGVAAIGFLGVFAAPAGVALAEAQTPAASTTVYASAVGDAQTIVISGDGTADLARSSYDVYVKPKPTPPPEPAAANEEKGAGSSSGGARPMYSGGGSPAEWMAAAGIAESDWGFVDYIVKHESGWNPNATNRSSGACGLVQALPCSKVPGNGYDPVDNLRWGSGYATGRYGSWEGAYNSWIAKGWW